MSKYLIEFTKFNQASVIVEYDQFDFLIDMKINYGSMDATAVNFLAKHIPSTLDKLEDYKKLPRVKVSDVPFDTSFITFYNQYAHKMGNKARSERLYEALKEEDQVKAIKYIQTYSQWLLQNTGVQKKLPETYLNQQPWNN